MRLFLEDSGGNLSQLTSKIIFQGLPSASLGRTDMGVNTLTDT